MQFKLPKPVEQAEIGLATVDQSQRHPQDRLLRSFRFRIVSRPKQGQPVWERFMDTGTWVHFTETEALQWIKAQGKAFFK